MTSTSPVPITPGNEPGSPLTPAEPPNAAPARRGLLDRVPSEWRTRPVLILSGLVLVLAVGLIASLAGTPDSPGGPSPLAAQSANATTPAPRPSASTPREWGVFLPEHLDIELVVTEKHCFGSAGCNVRFEPELSLVGWPAKNLEPGSRWDVTYQVHGAEDPFIGTIRTEVRGYQDVRYTTSEEFVSTARSSDELTATITAVRRR